MDSNTYILIGMSILAVSCIYLFYLNFQTMKDDSNSSTEIKTIKFLISKINDDINNTNHTIELHKKMLNTLLTTNHNSQSLSENDSLNLVHHEESQDEIDESKQSNTEFSQEIFPEAQELNQENLDDLDDLQELNELNDLDNLDDIENNVDNSEELLDNFTPDVEIEEILEEQKMNTEDDLANSTVKDLRLMAKNIGLSTKGNKDELIKRIIEKAN